MSASSLPPNSGPSRPRAQLGTHLLTPKQLLFLLPPLLLLLLLLLASLFLAALSLLFLPLSPELHFSALLELKVKTACQTWGYLAFPASVQPLTPKDSSPRMPTHFMLQLELF